MASLAADRGKLVDEICQVLGNAKFTGAELTRSQAEALIGQASRERTLWPVRSR